MLVEASRLDLHSHLPTPILPTPILPTPILLTPILPTPNLPTPNSLAKLRDPHLPTPTSCMKNFKSYFIIPTEPSDVYAALTNPLTIQLWTGEEAVMSAEPGSEFSMWEGSITGKNLEFDPHKKIVQQWYFGDQEEASIVTIKLHPHKQGTSVELIHTNIPDEAFEDITDGWKESYFGELEDFFAGE
jgi:uncharacterized protein YndB with AHSA1/START domain